MGSGALEVGGREGGGRGLGEGGWYGAVMCRGWLASGEDVCMCVSVCV